ncbi:hypothetical protein ACWCOP_13785 [Maricaulaceae bacterium MS644]
MKDGIPPSALAALLFLLSATGTANAQAARPASNYERLEERPDGETALIAYGDSIANGFSFRVLSPRLSASFYAGEPNANFRSPLHVLQMMLVQVDVEPTIVSYGGGSGLPGRSGVVESTVRFNNYFAAQRLRSDDYVVILDAGLHGCDIEAYLENLDHLMTSVASLADRAFFMLPFEVNTESWPLERKCLQWNQIFNEGELSVNDAIRALHSSSEQTQTSWRLIDRIEDMSNLRDELIARYGIDFMASDDIHYNVWGNIVIAIILMEAMGVDEDKIKSLALEGLLYDHVSKWGYRFSVRVSGEVLTPEESREILQAIVNM